MLPTYQNLSVLIYNSEYMFYVIINVTLLVCEKIKVTNNLIQLE